MAHASQNKRSVFLEDVEILFHEKSNTLSIISRDPDLPVGEMFLKIKEGTPTDTVLRKLFAEKTGNSKPLGSSLPKVVVVNDRELAESPLNQFPLGVDAEGNPVIVTFNPADKVKPRNTLITARSGGGKTVMLENLARKAYLWQMLSIHWSAGRDPQYFDLQVGSLMNWGEKNEEPVFVFIDGLSDYLRRWDHLTPKSPNLREAEFTEQLAHLTDLLQRSAEHNVTFVMTEQHPDRRVLEAVKPYLSATIIGQCDTVESAILLGDNNAVKLKTGQFLLTQEGKDRQVFQAYGPKK